MRPARRSRFLIPTLSAVVMLLVLIALGTWQIYRLHWKQGVLAQIAAAEAAPPVPLGPGPAPYAKVSVTGRFRYDLAAQYGSEVRDTRAGPTIGTYQIVPLERPGAPPILANRGWIPQRRETALHREDEPGVVLQLFAKMFVAAQIARPEGQRLAGQRGGSDQEPDRLDEEIAGRRQDADGRASARDLKEIALHGRDRIAERSGTRRPAEARHPHEDLEGGSGRERRATTDPMPPAPRSFRARTHRAEPGP